MSIGLVHEVLEPDQLLAAALGRADGLCAAPADVFALAKRQLHGPARGRIDTARPADDPQVLKMWGSERTRQTLRDYLASLRRR
jgi:enoyl-CoA hydratase